MPGRKTLLRFAAALTVLFIAAAPSAASAADEAPCNTAVELCDRTLDQVVLPGTHNSMSNEEYGWALPNQHFSIPTQLEMGVRAFLIDTFYGKPSDESGNLIENTDRAHSTGMFLCHTLCLIGSTPLIEELAKVKDFLAANPREVLVFVNEANITPADFASAVEESDLIEYVYEGSTDSYPTLEQMIASNQRVVMLSEGNTGDVPWYHNGYAGPLQETPYDFRRNEAGDVLTTQGGMNLLTDPATLDSTCRPHRGGSTGKLFLMNHWVNGTLDDSNPLMPDPEVAKVLNAKDVLANRARACEARRGKLPTIVAVDDFGDGDLLGAVDELNGVVRPDPDPDPEPIPDPQPIGPRVIILKKPKTVKVKAGRVAKFKITVANTGDRRAAKVKVCATAPKRLARKPRCVTVALAPGGKRTVKVKVPTRGRAKGRGAVKFTVHAPNGKPKARATLVVKAKKTRRR